VSLFLVRELAGGAIPASCAKLHKTSTNDRATPCDLWCFWFWLGHASDETHKPLISLAYLTRSDGDEFFAIVRMAGIRTETEPQFRPSR
jgi:hypothetical protein